MNNIEAIQGDITTAEVDAIVNAANPIMLGGGGVDGAIHKAAGSVLMDECLKVPSTNGVRCPFGEARITKAGDLHSKYVIHTVGPIYSTDIAPEKTLRSAYRNSLNLALENECQSIAFPAISCGVYGYPLEEAADIAIDESSKSSFQQLSIKFYLFSDKLYKLWGGKLQSINY